MIESKTQSRNLQPSYSRMHDVYLHLFMYFCMFVHKWNQQELEIITSCPAFLGKVFAHEMDCHQLREAVLESKFS